MNKWMGKTLIVALLMIVSVSSATYAFTAPPIDQGGVVKPEPEPDPIVRITPDQKVIRATKDTLSESMSAALIQISSQTVVAALNEIKTDEEAFVALMVMDDYLNKVVEVAKNSPQQQSEFTALVLEVSLKVEEKLNLVYNAENQVTILEKYAEAVKAFNDLYGVRNPILDRCLEDMMQNAAGKLGAFKMELVDTNESIRFTTVQFIDFIEYNKKHYSRLSILQKFYFANTVPRKFERVFRVDVSVKNGKPLKVDFTPNQIQLLKNNGIEAIVVTDTLADLKVPVSNLLTATQSIQVVLQRERVLADKDPINTIVPVGLEKPKLSYEVHLLVNNVKKEFYNQPITLGFDFKAFGLEQELPNELVIFKVNPSNKTWTPVGGIVDPESFRIYVIRNNLSQYTVMKTKKSFSDVYQSWAKEEINTMLNKGIVADAKTFSPQAILTRGEFSKWLAKAYGLKKRNAAVPFKDIGKSGEAYEAIAAVYQMGFISGKTATTFEPNKAITENEMAVIIGKVLIAFDNKQKSATVKSKYLAQLKKDSISTWAAEDMAMLMELGQDSVVRAGTDPITKEAAAAIFMKFYRS